ncbi:MAG: cysteine desulfurase [Verrucomicrobiales bacterium]|jgi:cysteine desulfurase
MPAATNEIYLDANATTRVLPTVAAAAKDAMEELFGNPSSAHITGLRARSILETARKLAKEAIGGGDGRIIFTSGATEAIQTAVFSSLVGKNDHCAGSLDGKALLYAATEHKAVPEALRHWNQILNLGAEVLKIPVDSDGQLEFDFLREHIGRAAMVCTMAVNNETGVVHDIPRIEDVIRSGSEGVPWMVDYVQAVAKLELDLSRTTIDYAPCSGHKLYAPKGIGMLYVRDGSPLVPLFAGGGQESGARGGTENLPGVAALAEVFRLLADADDPTFQSAETLVKYRDQLVESLEAALPDVVFNAPLSKTVPTTLNFSVRGFTSKELMDLFDAADIRVSSGSACGSALRGSYVLDEMGFSKARSEGAIRLSFGPATTPREIENACTRIQEAGAALRAACLIVSDDRGLETRGALDGVLQLKKGSMCTWIYIDAESRECVIIDPFEELSDRIESLIRCQNATVLAVLDTHNHVDHESPRKQMLERLSDCLAPGAHTDDLLGWPQSADGMVMLSDGQEAEYFQIGKTIIIAQSNLPGHTVIGRCFLLGEAVDGTLTDGAVQFAFTGDTLLIGGIGRTDFSASSEAAMLESLQRLPKIISPTTVICPTHDYDNDFTTTIEAEIAGNPFLAQILDLMVPIGYDEYAAEKKRLDSGIQDDTNSELVCGMICSRKVASSSIDVLPGELPSFFAEHAGALVVDVREPQEFQFVRDWSGLGLKAPPSNVPLSHFTNFLSGRLREREEDREIIFVCRSGTRSGKAAEVLRRLGFERAWHIAGGIALGGDRNRDAADAEYAI